MKNKKGGTLAEKLIDIELAKSNAKYLGIKKYLLIMAVLISFYYSYILGTGLALGYLGSKIFTKYLIECGKIGCIWINLGNWKLHLHHWIMGTIFLLLALFVDFFYMPKFFIGVLLGVIIHDIYDFDDWLKILVRKEKK